MGWKALGNKLADFNKSIEMEWVPKVANNPQAELFE
jgi:topoisomerase-4 subunit A